MESESDLILRKRMKLGEEEIRDGTGLEIVEREETEINGVGSEEMELNISNIVEKIEHFNQMVAELLESGKAMFKEMSNEFEERMHKDQIEKWQEEIKELRMLDASNEEAASILHNAKYVLQNPAIDS